MEKVIVDCSTGETTVLPLTAAAAQAEADRVAAQEAQEAREALKASAKAKLIAGQPLTEEEAEILVL
jgi:hypothetical protein